MPKPMSPARRRLVPRAGWRVRLVLALALLVLAAAVVAVTVPPLGQRVPWGLVP